MSEASLGAEVAAVDHGIVDATDTEDFAIVDINRDTAADTAVAADRGNGVGVFA